MSAGRKTQVPTSMADGVYAEAADGARPCPFCAHDRPVLASMGIEQTVHTVMCPECGASGPKPVPGSAAGEAVRVWNLRFGLE